MPHDVIMPALGMAQDSGLIVSWLKSPGDAVKAVTGHLKTLWVRMISRVEASNMETVPCSLPTNKYRPFSSYLIDDPQLSREV